MSSELGRIASAAETDVNCVTVTLTPETFKRQRGKRRTDKNEE